MQPIRPPPHHARTKAKLYVTHNCELERPSKAKRRPRARRSRFPYYSKIHQTAKPPPTAAPMRDGNRSRWAPRSILRDPQSSHPPLLSLLPTAPPCRLSSYETQPPAINHSHAHAHAHSHLLSPPLLSPPPLPSSGSLHHLIREDLPRGWQPAQGVSRRAQAELGRQAARASTHAALLGRAAAGGKECAASEMFSELIGWYRHEVFLWKGILLSSWVAARLASRSGGACVREAWC